MARQRMKGFGDDSQSVAQCAAKAPPRSFHPPLSSHPFLPLLHRHTQPFHIQSVSGLLLADIAGWREKMKRMMVGARAVRRYRSLACVFSCSTSSLSLICTSSSSSLDDERSCRLWCYPLGVLRVEENSPSLGPVHQPNEKWQEWRREQF